MSSNTPGTQPTVPSRKDDHIQFALDQQANAPQHSPWDDVEFIHHALGAIDVSTVSLATQVGEMSWQHPVYINAMTGGTDTALRVNAALAEAANETGTTIASGSVGVALDDASTAASFRVLRERNPNGVLIANIGAGRTLDDALRAVDLLEANALQIHVNAAQELVMPEGDRQFSRWVDEIARVVNGLSVPVIVKEVGFGLSRRTLETLRDIGVTIADVAGSGGTNFARIEGARRAADDPFTELDSWGQPAVACLVDAPEFGALLASGGVRTPLDVVRGLALGARAVGVAGTFLRTAISGDAAAVAHQLDWWKRRITDLCALLGAQNPGDLVTADVLLRGDLREFCNLRGIDAAHYSRRSHNRGRH